jgi:hypothetical protein
MIFFFIVQVFGLSGAKQGEGAADFVYDKGAN